MERKLLPLRELVSYEFLEGPATAQRIRDRLVAGKFHALHFQAHGQFDQDRSMAVVALEDEHRRVCFVDETILSEMFEGQRNLRLVTLIACHTGTPNPESAFSGLGPALVRRGISAVVAMRHQVSLEAASQFTEHFYLNLLRSGQIDVAANEARLQLHLMEPESTEWGTPALFMHLRDGLLWKLQKANSSGSEATSRESPTTSGPKKPRQRHRRPLIVAAAVVSLAIFLAVLTTIYTREATLDLTHLASHGPPKIVLSDFASLARDTSSDRTVLALSELLALELEHIRRLLPADSRFEVVRAEEELLAETPDPSLILTHPQYSSEGDRFRLSTRLKQIQGTEAAILEISGRGTEDLVESIGRLSRALVRGLGLEPTVSSSEDLSHYVDPERKEATRILRQALDRMRILDSPTAQTLLEEALTIEPRSPLLHSALALALRDLGRKKEAEAAIEKALWSSKTSRSVDRCFLLAQNLEVRAEWQRAAAVLQLCMEADSGKATESDEHSEFDRGLRLAALQSKARWASIARTTLDNLRHLAEQDPRYPLIEAELHRSLSQYEEQKETARLTASRARDRKAPLLQARALILEAEALQRLGDPQAATTALEAARVLYHNAEHHKGEADAHQLIGNSLLNRGNLAEAGQHYDEARSLYAAVGNKLMEARVLGNKALILKQQGDDQAAILLYENCLDLHRRNHDRGGEVYTLIHLAEIFEKTGAIPEAEESLESALEIERSGGADNSAAYPLRVLGAFRSRHGSLTESMTLLEQALELYRNTDNRQGEWAAATQLARVLHQRGDLDTSRQLFEGALDFYRKSANEDNIADIRKDLGDVLTAMGDTEAAAEAYAQALETQDLLVDRIEPGRTRLALARLLLVREEEFGAVEQAVAAALADLDSTGATLEKALAHSVLALAYLKRQRPEEAKEEIETSRSLLGQTTSPAFYLPVEMVAARIETETRAYESANRRLHAVVAAAVSNDFFELKLEAQLLRGELSLKTGNDRAGVARLRDVESEAAAHGFHLISRKAAEVIELFDG